MLDCPEQLSAVRHSSGEQEREHVRLGVDHVGEEVAGVELEHNSIHLINFLLNQLIY